jgi:hypothetical protein
MSAVPNTCVFALLLALFTPTDPVIREYFQCGLNAITTAFCFRVGLFVQKVNSFCGLSASVLYPVLIS